MGEEPQTVLILAAYSVEGRWGWEALAVDPGRPRLAERHDAGLRYDTQGAAQEAGLAFCARYFKRAPQVLRVNGATMKGRRVKTGGL